MLLCCFILFTLTRTHLMIPVSFKSLLHNSICRNASQYTVNKQTYIHSLYINTKTYQQINVLHYKYNYITTNQLNVYIKRKREGHTNQIKGYARESTLSCKVYSVYGT